MTPADFCIHEIDYPSEYFVASGDLLTEDPDTPSNPRFLFMTCQAVNQVVNPFGSLNRVTIQAPTHIHSLRFHSLVHLRNIAMASLAIHTS